MESFDSRTLIQSTRFRTNEIFLQLSLIREKIFKLAIVIEHEEIVFPNISLKNRTTLFIQQVRDRPRKRKREYCHDRSRPFGLCVITPRGWRVRCRCVLRSFNCAH